MHPRVLTVIWACGCTGEPAVPTPGVLAPRSLQPVLEPVVAAWETAHGTRVRLGFDAPDRLLRQANGGTRADVFVSADPRWMDALVADGHVEPQSRRPVAYDPLVFVAAPGQPPARDPRDLVVRLQGPLGVGNPDLPEGDLAQRALEATMVWDQLADRVVSVRGPSELRERLEAGELEAAVTVRSVVLLAHDTLATHPFSPDLAFGSTIEVAPLVRRNPVDPELIDALVSALVDGPDARAGWSRAGLDAMRGRDPVGSASPPLHPPPSGEHPPAHPAVQPPPRPPPGASRPPGG